MLPLCIPLLRLVLLIFVDINKNNCYLTVTFCHFSQIWLLDVNNCIYIASRRMGNILYFLPLWKIMFHKLPLTYYFLASFLLFFVLWIVCRVPWDLNCLRAVECILGNGTRSNHLKIAVAYQLLLICFDNKVACILS